VAAQMWGFLLSLCGSGQLNWLDSLRIFEVLGSNRRRKGGKKQHTMEKKTHTPTCCFDRSNTYDRAKMGNGDFDFCEESVFLSQVGGAGRHRNQCGPRPCKRRTTPTPSSSSSPLLLRRLLLRCTGPPLPPHPTGHTSVRTTVGCWLDICWLTGKRGREKGNTNLPPPGDNDRASLSLSLSLSRLSSVAADGSPHERIVCCAVYLTSTRTRSDPPANHHSHHSTESSCWARAPSSRLSEFRSASYRSCGSCWAWLSACGPPFFG
jgi:hypothetical protein